MKYMNPNRPLDSSRNLNLDKHKILKIFFFLVFHYFILFIYFYNEAEISPKKI